MSLLTKIKVPTIIQLLAIGNPAKNPHAVLERVSTMTRNRSLELQYLVHEGCVGIFINDRMRSSRFGSEIKFFKGAEAFPPMVAPKPPKTY